MAPLDSTIVVALIMGGMTLVGTIITVLGANKRQASDAKANQKIMSNKIDELTREVRVHNGFAERIPKIEAKLDAQNERIDRIEERIEKHEDY